MTAHAPRLRTGLAWVAPAACVGLLVAGLAMARHTTVVLARLLEPGVVGLVPLSLGFAVIGALILSRHPRHGLGWLYTGTALAMAGAVFAYAYAWHGLVTAPGSLPGALAVAWVSAWIWTLGGPPAMTFGLLLYPDGRLPSRRWRPTAVVFALAIAGLWLATAFSPGPLTNHPVAENPLGIPGTRAVLQAVGTVAEPLTVLGFAAGGAALVVRWR